MFEISRDREERLPRIWSGSEVLRAFKDHFRDDQNQEYVLIAVRHEGKHDAEATATRIPHRRLPDLYTTNSFGECLPASTPIRPQRRTPVPVVQGCHTAVVIGPSGQEIFTDKYGRVKVQFNWDREGKENN